MFCTSTIEYPPSENILPGQSTAKTLNARYAYQQGENAAVRFWGRNGYGAWPSKSGWTPSSICAQFIRKDKLQQVKISEYKSYDDLPLFLNAAMVAKVLGIAPSSSYELMHEADFPVLRIGNRLVVPKEKFIQWVAQHTQGGADQ